MEISDIRCEGESREDANISCIVYESELISVHGLVTTECLESSTLIVRVVPRTSLVQLLQEGLVRRLHTHHTHTHTHHTHTHTHTHRTILVAPPSFKHHACAIQ